MHVFDTMGTTVSLRTAGRRPPADVLHAVEDVFDDFDRRFSLYRPDSEISHVARGELLLHRAGRELRDSYAEALDWSRRTDSAFTPHRPDGVLDLSGLVKAKAIDAAGLLLDASGETGWLLNAGGDVLRGGTRNGAPWRVGIVDPDDRNGLLCSVELTGSRRAIATSGTAERGEHVWRGPAAAHSPFYRHVSVLADDIVTADVSATAILAGGPGSCDDILDRFDIDVLTVDGEGDLTASPGMRALAGFVTA